MQRALAGRNEEIEREITIGHGIKAVSGWIRKTERLRGHIAINGKTRPRQRRASQRALVEALPSVLEAGYIARDHLVIGHQMMPQSHRLRGLQMGEAGHDRRRMLISAVDQCVL